MDKEQSLLSLTRRINDAVAAQDWKALAMADRDMSSQLSALLNHRAWSRGERDALTLLQDAHRQACEWCNNEIALLGDILAEMRNNKDGWLAYAYNGELDERE